MWMHVPKITEMLWDAILILVVYLSIVGSTSITNSKQKPIFVC